jgi:hypothetical protein
MISVSKREFAFAAAFVVLVGFLGCATDERPPDGAETVHAKPRIFPDYASVVIPPNIAPLRFRIEEPGAVFRTRIHGGHGTDIVVSRSNPSATIPEPEWRQLLESNRGGVLQFEVMVRDRLGGWRRFEAFDVRVAPESVDDYLVYRRKLPGKEVTMRGIQMRQRTIGSFEEKVVLDGERLGMACINCHLFAGNKARFVALSFRSRIYGVGTLLMADGAVEKIPVKMGFSSWHPSGDVIVFSQNRMSERGTNSDSQLAYYRRATRTVRNIPGLSRPGWLEDIGTFSADGREFYAATARKPWGTRPVEDVPIDAVWQGVPTDLVRARFDNERDEWSEPELMISSRETGKSVIFARTSPDGRWLSVRMMDPLVIGACDFYLVDLERARATGRFEPVEMGLTAGYAKGWHSWSSEGRWLVFSSSRETGYFTRPYLTYVDADGKAHKPVLLPVEEPSEAALDPFMWDTPMLSSEPVQERAGRLVHAIRSENYQPVDNASTPPKEAAYK